MWFNRFQFLFWVQRIGILIVNPFVMPIIEHNYLEVSNRNIHLKKIILDEVLLAIGEFKFIWKTRLDGGTGKVVSGAERVDMTVIAIRRSTVDFHYPNPTCPLDTYSFLLSPFFLIRRHPSRSNINENDYFNSWPEQFHWKFQGNAEWLSSK